MALKKEFDVLLVFMFDRIGRREDETPFVVEWFVKQGVEVWSVKEGEQRFENHVDKLTNYIRFWQASGESIKTSQRIKTRLGQLTEDGIYTGGTVSFGYKLVKNGRVNKKGVEVFDMEIEPAEAECVKLIFEKTLKEGLGSHRIARLLNEEGIKTHNGSKFQSNTVNRILKNRLYCGYLVSGGTSSKLIKKFQIIDENVFDNIQDMVKQRISKNTERTIPLTTRGKTLLSGNIFCAHCSGRLVVTKYQDRYIRKDGTEYKLEQLKYTCYHKTRKLNNCDGQTSYTAETIDVITTDILNELFSKIKETPKDKAIESRYKSKVKSIGLKQKNLSAEVEKYKNQLENLKLEIGKALVGESPFTADQLGEAIKATQGKLTESENSFDKVNEELYNKKEAMGKLGYYYNQFVSWATEFQSASLEQQKMIASQLISGIKVSKGYNVAIEFNMDYQQFCVGM